MSDRKKLIEGIITNFQAMKNKMHARMMQREGEAKITHTQLFVLAIIEKNENLRIHYVCDLYLEC